MGINFKAIWAMLKRIDYVKLGSGMANFVKRNESTLVYGAGSLGLAALAKKYNIPLGDACKAYASKDKILDFDELQRMNNPKDAAITSMATTAMKSYSTSTELEAVNGIKNMVLNSTDISGSTMAYAIRKLEEIAKNSYSSKVENEVQKAIMAIGAKG